MNRTVAQLVGTINRLAARLRGLIESTAFLGERARLTIGGAAPEPLGVNVADRIELPRCTAVRIPIDPDAPIALS
ncbi:hypothetical protein BTH42_17065 [Burkholderia sp. SRS-W-2-2016]|uniref:hypothetical protein n=1 Tax=Burkholderia sp. SRS-W-2-2016 TaxID=1926878 RepID=UPI00094AED2F|nr:hypothetical protein BTH42_17065 [Burkholderia sp. SRS-W-2-2016]